LKQNPDLNRHLGNMSPPARGRGLKPLVRDMVARTKRSPPARGRGLKPRPRED